jgi:uncharacterized protein (DUF305 family)
MSDHDNGDHSSEGAAPPPSSSWRPQGALQWFSLGLALVVLGVVAGYVVGHRNDEAPSRDSVDVGFLYDMLVHHEQGQRLSTAQLVNGEEPEVSAFAREFLRDQSYEIGLMEQKLAEWGYPRDPHPGTAMAWMGNPTPVATMPGMATAGELRTLERSRGREVDARFIPLMQEHHRGAVHMASYAATHAKDPFVRKLAGVIARNQQTEIRALDEIRERTGLSPLPAA